MFKPKEVAAELLVLTYIYVLQYSRHWCEVRHRIGQGIQTYFFSDVEVIPFLFIYM